MTGYFRSRWNFKFENSYFLQWLKSQKGNWRTRVNFGLMKFERFYWSIKRVEFYTTLTFSRKFLRIVEIKNFQKKRLIKNQIKLLINKIKKIKIFVLVLNNLFCEVLKKWKWKWIKKWMEIKLGTKNKKKIKIIIKKKKKQELWGLGQLTTLSSLV